MRRHALHRFRSLPFMAGMIVILVPLGTLLLTTNTGHDGMKPRPDAAQKTRRWPRPQHPEEFARILNEMKIPAGQTTPGYELGYRTSALRKARTEQTGLGLEKTNLPWISRGPGNVAGRARGLVIDPDDPSFGTWFVGSVGGGIWKTTDAGANWQTLSDDFPNLAVSTLAMSASNPDVVYAGTGESFFNVDGVNGNGILKSIDRGQTWAPLTNTLDDPRFNNISRIIVDPDDPDIVLASTTTGGYKVGLNSSSSIFKSIDGGVTWTEVYTETETGGGGRVKKVLQLVATPGDFSVLYAAIDEKGVLKSTDAGDTWALSNNGIGDFTGRFELALSPVDTDRVFAAAEGNPFSNLFVSTNAGASWTQTTDVFFEANWLGAQGWYDNTIAAHPTDPNTVYVGGVQLFRIDLVGGSQRSTSFLDVGPVHVDHHNLVVFDVQGGSFRILNANDGGIGVSSSGDTGWSKPTTGMITTQFYGVDKKPGASAYVGGMQDNGTWRSPEDAGMLDFWSFQIGGDGYETSWHFDDPLKIIGGYQYNGLQRSLDGGASYEDATTGLLDTGAGNAPFITKIGKTNDMPERLFAVGASGVWRSNDFGATWLLSPITAPSWAPISSFTDVKVSRANPDVVWAGARMDDTGRINVSIDGGVTFLPTINYTDVTMGGISGLATHPGNDQTAYVLFSFAAKPKVLRTTDQGLSWTDLSGFGTGSVSTNGFPDVAVYDLLVFPHDTNKIWVGTEIGLFESDDGGASWHLAANGLPAAAIWAMTHVEDEVVVATHGRGVWSVSIPEMIAGQTFKPLLRKAYQAPDGLLYMDIGLRSSYDSTTVQVNGSHFITLEANAAGEDTMLTRMVTVDETVTLDLVSHVSGTGYPSVVRSVDVVPFSDPQLSYFNDFNSPTNDFTGSFVINTQTGFSNGAIHSNHPYEDAAAPTFRLNVPIRVGGSEAKISYQNVAIIEPGNPGTQFGDPSFWDYVIVEGTRDGCVWQPLLDGYDAQSDPAWENAYYGGNNGNESMYRNQEIDLLETFSPGENILIRFKLYADAFVNSWGWAIDNLDIQPNATSVAEGNQAPPLVFGLRQNQPNPFNASTTIHYTLPRAGRVHLTIYDVRGREVRSLVNGRQPAGPHSVAWKGRANDGSSVASGVYVYRLDSEGQVAHRKMVVVK